MSSSTVRIYIVKGRLYQLMATSAKGKQDADLVKKFLGSFQLTEKAEKKP
jgi:hypothetical protein